MDQNVSKHRVSARCLLIVLPIVLCAVFQLPSIAQTQQPTAIIRSLTGAVVVSIQGEASVTAAEGTILQSGDIIETKAEAEAILVLSEGSELHLGQNTKIDIAALTQNQGTKVRKSRLKLWYGRIRAILSPGHQEKGSSFTVETPNARAGVKFSQPDIEVIYKPDTKTTIIIGHTVAVTITNLLTKEIKGMPEAHQAIVQDEFLWIAPFIPGTEEIPSDWKQRHNREGLFSQSRQIVGGTVSAVPISAGTRSEINRGPGPGSSSTGHRPKMTVFNMSEE